jgi:SAM-dependent methyltransferase
MCDNSEDETTVPAVATEVASPAKGSQYDPLPSVWEGTDAELIEKMLDFYPRHTPEAILDATVNKRRFWVGSTRPVTGMDIDPRHKPDVVGDFRAMPFADESFDVVVFDPPHVPNQGRDQQKDFRDRFGLGETSGAATGYSLSHLYPPFCAEAFRVLRPEGVLFAKIADYVHNHRMQWAHLDFLAAAQAVGFTNCDLIVKVRKGPIKDPKWKTAHHARRQHAFWIVCRKSKKCE